MSLKIQGTTITTNGTGDLTLGVSTFTNALVVSGTNGNIGIGTNAPQFDLDIIGSLNIGSENIYSTFDNTNYNPNLPILSKWSSQPNINSDDIIYDRANILIPYNASSIDFEMIGAGGYGFGDSTNNSSINDNAKNQGGTGGYFKGTINVASFRGKTITIQVGRTRQNNNSIDPNKRTSSTASFISIVGEVPLIIAGAGGNGSAYNNILYKGGNAGGGNYTQYTDSLGNIIIGGTSGVQYNNTGNAGGGGTLTGGTGANPGANADSTYIDAEGGKGGTLVSYANGGNGYTGGGGGSGSGGGGSSFYNPTYVTITSTKNGSTLTNELQGFGRSSKNGYVSISINTTNGPPGTVQLSNTLLIGKDIGSLSVTTGYQNGLIKFGTMGDSQASIEQRIYSYNSGGAAGIQDKAEMFLYMRGDGDPGNAYGPERIRLKAGEIRFDTYDFNISALTNTTKYYETTKLIIRPDGNVGIGTNTPGSLLDVSGNALIRSGLTINNTLNTSSIITTGNVGIGITTPGSLLDVNGNANIRNILYLGTESLTASTINTVNGSIVFHGISGDGGVNNCVIEQRLFGGYDKSELLLYKGNDFSTIDGPDRIRLKAPNILFDTFSDRGIENDNTTRITTTTKMIIDTTGNVGIGTTTPQSLLHVNGLIKGTNGMKYNLFKLDNINTEITVNTMKGYVNSVLVITPTTNIICRVPQTDQIDGIGTFYKIVNKSTAYTITIKYPLESQGILLVIYPSQVAEIIAITNSDPGEWVIMAP